MNKKFTFYEILVFVAYGFYLLLGLLWFALSLVNGRMVNGQAFIIILVFSAQFYFRHRLTNLILGIFALFLSIWFLLEVLSGNDTGVKHASYDNLSIALICFFAFSIIMAGILIFGYAKLSFKDR